MLKFGAELFCSNRQQIAFHANEHPLISYLGLEQLRINTRITVRLLESESEINKMCLKRNELKVISYAKVREKGSA